MLFYSILQIFCS